MNRKQRRSQKQSAKQISPVDALLTKAKIAFAKGDLEQTKAICKSVIELDPKHVDSIHLAALVAKKYQNYQAAVNIINAGLAIDPNHHKCLVELGACLIKLGYNEKAQAALRKALETEPESAEALFYLGNAIHADTENDDKSEAKECLEKALLLKPDHAASMITLVEIYDQENRLDKAAAYVDMLKNVAPDTLYTRLYEARLLEREKKYQEALLKLDSLEDQLENQQEIVKVKYFQTMASLLERSGDTEKAFDYYLKQNDADRKRFASSRMSPAYIDGVIRSYQNITPNDIAAWPDPDISDGREDPVFFVGFPRSGTTLLENVLDTLPETGSLSEKPALGRVREQAGDINELDVSRIPELRKMYFDSAARQTGTGVGILLDKHPLHIIDLPLIYRLFPKAKVIYALRHPCDCVLSCFIQSFAPNSSMAHFLSMEDSARFYSDVMGLFLQHREAVPLPMHEYRYERMVEDFDGETKAVLDFLGLEWSDDIRDYSERIRQSGRRINTPSYSQVSQPIYKTAKGRWHKYREHMEPVLPILEPFIKEFGYTT